MRYADLDIADPFHPMLDNVDSTNYEASMLTPLWRRPSSKSRIFPRPAAQCGASGSRRFLQGPPAHQAETVQQSETILGVCSYYSG